MITNSGEVSYGYSYHSGLDMVLSKVLCDDHADCHSVGQG